MSQSFRWKYDQMRENNPGSQESKGETQSVPFDISYGERGHARTICFVWQDGRRIFLNYSFLISGQYLPSENMVTLTFTTHVIILKGINLERLFYDVMQQVAKQIICTDARYNSTADPGDFLVNEIQMAKNTS